MKKLAIKFDVYATPSQGYALAVDHGVQPSGCSTGTRLAGPKLYGQGRELASFDVSLDDLIDGIPELRERIATLTRERDELAQMLQRTSAERHNLCTANARLRGALEPFARFGTAVLLVDGGSGKWHSILIEGREHTITREDFRRALAALAGEEEVEEHGPGPRESEGGVKTLRQVTPNDKHGERDNMTTIAERLIGDFQGPYLTREIIETLNREGDRTSPEYEVTVWEFSDGSRIIDRIGGYDYGIQGATCLCWAGLGHDEECSEAART